MTPLVIPMPGNETLAMSLAQHLHGDVGALETRAFPDNETYLRFQQDPRGRPVILVCTMNHPNPKFLPLIFAADNAKELGATKVSLIAPYLCYMRQDKRFHKGEALTSTSFARQLSSAFDELVTVDPHLHRHRSLVELYSIRTAVVHSAPLIAANGLREMKGELSSSVLTPKVSSGSAKLRHWHGRHTECLGRSA
jgi:ribose-phosphate pyrophosphokinase